MSLQHSEANICADSIRLLILFGQSAFNVVACDIVLIMPYIKTGIEIVACSDCTYCLSLGYRVLVTVVVRRVNNDRVTATCTNENLTIE